MEKTQLNLLGNFSIIRPDNTEVVIRGRKNKALITLIALSHSNQISRDKVISKLWAKRSIDQARGSLRTLLNELGKSFENPDLALVKKDAQKNTIYIDRDLVQIDVDQLAEYANTHTIEQRRKVLDLYQGDLLEDFRMNEDAFQEWLNIERIQFRDLFRETLIDLLEHYQTAQSFEDAIYVAHRMIALESTDEKAHRALMSIYQAQGNKTEALKQYQTCFDATMSLINEPPSVVTRELFENIQLSNTKGENSRGAVAATEESAENRTERLSVGVIALKCPDSIREDIDQITSDVISALARFKWLAVAPRSTTFGLRDQNLSAVEIGRNLNIQYILDGNARDIGRDSSLSVELIDVVDESVIWGDRHPLPTTYDVSAGELLVGKIVSQIETRLRANEVRRVLGSQSNHFDAYDSTWFAISSMYEMTESSFESAKQLFEQAEREDSNYAPIYSWWALWQAFSLGQGWSKNRKDGILKAFQLARKAHRIDPEDALALAIMGHCEAFLSHQFDEAIDCFRDSLALNPNSAFAWALSSATYSYCGEPEEALRRLERSEQLCPIEPHFGFIFDTAKAIAYTFKQNYREAARWARRTVRQSPYFANAYKPLIASLGHLDEIPEAAEYLRRLLELENDFCINKFKVQYPFRHEIDKDRYVAGLVKAGVPNESKVRKLKVISHTIR